MPADSWNMQMIMRVGLKTYVGVICLYEQVNMLSCCCVEFWEKSAIPGFK